MRFFPRNEGQPGQKQKVRMNYLVKGVRGVLTLLIMAAITQLLVGCASISPEAKEMVPAKVSVQRQYSKSVRLVVSGGGAEFLISDHAFRSAIEEAVRSSNLFREISEKGDYQLDVFIGDYQFPLGGMSMTTNMEVLWSLSNVSTRKTVWQRLIRTSETATVGDAFIGQVRARKSAEFTGRENIRQALEQLSQLIL